MSRRIPVGLAYSREFLDLLADNGNNYTVTKQEFGGNKEDGYDLNRIYQPWSLTSSVALVHAVWMTLFANCAFLCVVYLRLHKLESHLVDITLQDEGKVDTHASGTMTQRLLERKIKKHIPHLDSVAWRNGQTAAEGQVARVQIGGDALGTAFLVGPAAVLTNYHVVESILDGEKDAKDVTLQFDYKVSAGGARTPGYEVRLHSTQPILDQSRYAPCEEVNGPPGNPTEDELDYALLQLERAVGMEKFTPDEHSKPRPRGWITLPDTLPTLALSAPLAIVQYPDGGPLKFTFDTDSYEGPTACRTRLRYSTNTEPGSSGSPVFDFQWNIVALHHLGDPAFHDRLSRYNQGIRIDKIKRRILREDASEASLRVNAISFVIPSL